MGGIANLVLRGRAFYFRRRVPADLWERLGRRELVRSPATADPRAARARACQLYLGSEGLFMALREAQAARCKPMVPRKPLVGH